MTGKNGRRKTDFNDRSATAGGRQKKLDKISARAAAERFAVSTGNEFGTGYRGFGNGGRKNDWTFSETKELSDYRHYAACKDYLREYRQSGYGKENPSREQTLRLAAAAADMEISAVGGEALLPLLESVSQSLEKAEGYIGNLDARKLNDPIVYALAERDGKKLAVEAGKQAADAAAVYRDLARVLQQKRIVRKMQHDCKKEGKQVDLSGLNEKICGAYSHALEYVQKYEERELRRSIEKSGFNPTEISAAVVALANGGGDETTG